MKLIIGLGNPQKKYFHTRHNAGFIILDCLREKFDFSEFKKNEKFKAKISEGKIGDEKYLFVKAQTFMNLSGKSLKAIMIFYKLIPEEIVIIHDDLDLDLGVFKISLNHSAAGHNGVQSIYTELGTQKIKRIRIGIEGAEKKKTRIIPGSDFVLQNFSDEELEIVKKLTPEIAKNI